MSDRSRPLLEARRSNERPHVLVVSDDPDLSAFLTDGLPLGGFWVSVIASGLQALEVFRLRQFDLLAIDVEMRSFDAFELLRRLRGVSTLDGGSGARTTAPVVLFGVHALPEDELAILGVADTIAPPIELEEVVRVLHQVFAEWRQSNPDTPLADSANLAF
jgi:two-component system response regulator TrcR